MPTEPVYVTLLRRWKPKAKRWETAAGVGRDRPPAIDPTSGNDHRLATFEVLGCPTIGEGVPCVMEWLARGRPATMSIRQLDSCIVNGDQAPGIIGRERALMEGLAKVVEAGVHRRHPITKLHERRRGYEFQVQLTDPDGNPTGHTATVTFTLDPWSGS